MDRVQRFKLLLWSLCGLGFAVAIARYIFGLGATTNLSDAFPWGVWIGFDVMSGVALAGGGFVITATVYIFRLEKYHAIVRPAVLTALLGYAAVAVGLLFDLGLPWNIWHMIVYWNIHSPLFEVGWCVMLYLTVLTLEFFPVPAEDFSWLGGIRRILTRLRLPLVITGIALSTLHQSSLGSLFLIMPYNLHPLWYSPILPIIFFASAIGLGLLMVTFESLLTSWLYRRKPETHLLAGLGGAARWVLLIYLALRFTDMAVRGQFGELSSAGHHVTLFWVEIACMGLIPMILLFIPGVRKSVGGLWTVAIIGISGIVFNRINVGGLAHLGRGDMMYLPAWTEIAISAAVVAAAALAFLFMVERFNVWEHKPVDPDEQPETSPNLHPVDKTWLGNPARAALVRNSLGFILVASFGFMLISGQPVESRGVSKVLAQKARGCDTLWIDGDHNGFGTQFFHQRHIDTLHNCAVCHHMNLPGDRNSGCCACHEKMYLPSDAFRHEWHSSPNGADLACTRCHEQGKPKTIETAAKCDKCHNDLIPAGAKITVNSYQAAAYSEAMHRMCLGCHAEYAKNQNNPGFAQCATCHNERRELPGVTAQPDKALAVNPVLPPKQLAQ